MCNVAPIKPTVGMSKMDQLRAFVVWEQEAAPEKTHIAAWALLEIERLRAAIQLTLDENGHLADGDNCTLIVLKRALDVPNVEVSQPRGPELWPIKGVRVDGDKVIVAVKGGNNAARWLCGELIAMFFADSETERMKKNAKKLRPKPNFVFLSGEVNPLNLDASERRFMVVMDDVEPSNRQIKAGA